MSEEKTTYKGFSVGDRVFVKKELVRTRSSQKSSGTFAPYSGRLSVLKSR